MKNFSIKHLTISSFDDILLLSSIDDIKNKKYMEVKTMKFRSQEKRTAYNVGGWRERYAMENGNAETVYINGERCIKYTYSKNVKYQDANGAIYNTVKKQWIN